MKNSINLVNLTPHEIRIIREDQEVVIQPSGTIARCQVEQRVIGSVNGIPVYKASYGQVENLPDPQEGVIYIVSALVAQAVPNRKDVLIPFDSVRDQNGKIVGCKALAHV